METGEDGEENKKEGENEKEEGETEKKKFTDVSKKNIKLNLKIHQNYHFVLKRQQICI